MIPERVNNHAPGSYHVRLSVHAVEEQRHRSRADMAARDRLIAHGQAVAGEAALAQRVEQKLRTLGVIRVRDADLFRLVRDQLFIEVSKGSEGLLAPARLAAQDDSALFVAAQQGLDLQHRADDSGSLARDRRGRRP